MQLTILSGKFAAVTGATAGIGLACSKALLNAGAKVALIHYDEKKLKAICDDLGENAIPVVVDVTNKEDVNSMMGSILEKMGGLDIFIGNAGSYVGGDIPTGNPDQWDKMIDLNVKGLFRCVHAVLPYMIEKKGGDIITIGSIAGIEMTAGEPVYCSTKHAVMAFRRGLRRQVNKYGIRIGGVEPGPVKTKLLKDWDQEQLAKILEMGAVIDPEDVAECVIFMVTRPKNVLIRDMVVVPNILDL